MTQNSEKMVAYTTGKVLLEVKDVSLSFGKNNILRSVTAEVKDIVGHGQVIGFLGPSGIGKTQLSRIMAGLQAPTSGSVLVNGQPVKPGTVGMVDQRYTLFDWGTVRQNFAAVSADKAKIARYVEAFGLNDSLLKYPYELSGGTRQRIAIAQHLLCSEHFVVMDEPFSGLDMVMKERACQTILDMSNLSELNTAIVVTHDILEAASISDHLWLMGYERDSSGQCVPGARIIESYDLAAMGLAWNPDIKQKREFQEFVLHVRERFRTLKEF